MTRDELRAIKKQAKVDLQQPGVVGFGLGEDTLRVYVESAALLDTLPEHYKGLPVVVEVTGTIVASGKEG